ncbi:hypothetical protein CC85DRAFT_154951 [Cutaneotrichosporon oleaginosum]|uniref:N-acetyltransferase domain-containing protein n=1 Tax=Cutaneotrichosporon oleaginosum TaxID=879819 RepID=A0A0J0XW51_9TREE|nr:uncharacterized protein CC85DRAFT_154951 [Cutaneotrichosporon oleaginosum]KLT45306.1 hypothetical protein CC85DRAFT_154951 [Cutaneotrichosporon oleaginosum]TXT14865.1 hypothetical protein COLE_01058 [Cutaneotrichosporon oleaginosum]
MAHPVPEHTVLWGHDRTLSHTLMQATVAHTLAKHRVWVAESEEGGDILGVGLWTDPGAAWFTEEDVPAVFGSVMAMLDPTSLAFMLGEMLPRQAEIEEAYAPGCSADWYFGAMLGVDPRAQGRGVGGNIVDAIVRRAGDVPVAFHTQGAKNVSFYGKHGFKVAAEREFVLPNGEKWCDKLMVRRPDGSV